MQLILVDPKPGACDILRKQFCSHRRVSVVCGRFESLPVFDCFITAANSFGLMDGGVDRAVVKFFGEAVMETAQQLILRDYLGEQPVGTCLLIRTGHPRHPFVAHTPTMRIPMNICGTDNVYLAMWAALTAIHRHNCNDTPKIETVACPALGAGTGGMDMTEVALQIRFAYEHFLEPPRTINGLFAQLRHERIHFGGRWGFQHPRPYLK